ncbi:MAG: hypothetical protein M5U29_03220 [Anaerolineae bacterium]|nr:hypothetical protein [Anaerolineae bacterium]
MQIRRHLIEQAEHHQHDADGGDGIRFEVAPIAEIGPYPLDGVSCALHG